MTSKLSGISECIYIFMRKTWVEKNWVLKTDENNYPSRKEALYEKFFISNSRLLNVILTLFTKLIKN